MRMGLGVRYKKRKFLRLFFIICITAFVCLILKRLEPAYNSQIAGYANSMINEIVNSTVNEVFSNGGYDSFADMERTADNKITAIEADTAKINRLKSQLLTEIQNNLKNCEAKTVSLPLFSASNFHVLSGIGPKIPVHIAPIAVINSDFTESFDSAGINQVRHRLVLNISANVSCTGFMFSKSEKVDTEIPILETVITGEIPNYYGGNIGVMGK